MSVDISAVTGVAATQAVAPTGFASLGAVTGQVAQNAAQAASSTSVRGGAQAGATGTPQAATAAGKDSKTATQDQAASETPVKLSDKALAQLRALQARDQQVRAHEQAHLAAAGGLATSAPSYTYEKGPDGVNYAIGGEVSIDVSPGRNPQDTIARAKVIEAAALAPADPSAQDFAVAAQARQMEQQARAELASEKQQDSAQPHAAPSAAAQAYANADATAQVTHLINSYA